MKWIGLTGSMGSGKSAVAEIIRELGYPVLDADAEARKALAIGSAGLSEVARAFGPDLLRPDGSLNREQLGRVVFNSPEKLRQLEGIVHPIVQKSVLEQRQTLAKSGVRAAFYDVPLLFEKGLQKNFDKVIVVNSRLENMIERVALRSGLSREDILDRLNNQIPLLEKVAKADIVIDNNGTLADLRSAVKTALASL